MIIVFTRYWFDLDVQHTNGTPEGWVPPVAVHHLVLGFIRLCTSDLPCKRVQGGTNFVRARDLFSKQQDSQCYTWSGNVEKRQGTYQLPDSLRDIASQDPGSGKPSHPDDGVILIVGES